MILAFFSLLVCEISGQGPKGSASNTNRGKNKIRQPNRNTKNKPSENEPDEKIPSNMQSFFKAGPSDEISDLDRAVGGSDGDRPKGGSDDGRPKGGSDGDRPKGGSDGDRPAVGTGSYTNGNQRDFSASISNHKNKMDLKGRAKNEFQAKQRQLKKAVNKRQKNKAKNDDKSHNFELNDLLVDNLDDAMSFAITEIDNILADQKLIQNGETFLSWEKKSEDVSNDNMRQFSETYSKSITKRENGQEREKTISVNVNIDKVAPGVETAGPKISHIGFEIKQKYTDNKKTVNSNRDRSVDPRKIAGHFFIDDKIIDD